MTGTIDSTSGGTLTINTAQGNLQITVTDDTVIQQTVEVSIGDLALGTRVTVTGAPGEDGIVEATSIFVIPEGQEGEQRRGFGGGGFGGGVRPGGGGFGGGGGGLRSGGQ